MKTGLFVSGIFLWWVYFVLFYCFDCKILFNLVLISSNKTGSFFPNIILVGFEHRQLGLLKKF